MPPIETNIVKGCTNMEKDKNVLLYTMNDSDCYGQIFSTYALYQATRKLGWNPVVYDEAGRTGTGGQDYIKVHCCTLSEMCLHSDREKYLESFHAVITGSERKWKCAKNESVEKCFLDWGNPAARRIAYAPTFGADCDLPLGPKNAAYFLMRRLAIAAADSDTRRILNLEFQIDAEAVCNPILLADDFAHADVKSVEGLFISVFFERSDSQKQKVAELAEESLKYRVLDYSREAMKRNSISVDEYLNAIEKSSLIITDSVAAMHLAIFYKKPFITVLSHHGDGPFSRLSTLEQLGLTERVIYVEEDVREKKYLCRKPVKYGLVDYKLEKLRLKSMKWLEDSLNGQETDK